MADNDQKVAERDGDATTSTSTGGQRSASGGDNDGKKDVEARGQAARRGPGKAKDDDARKRSSLDFDVSKPVSVRGGYMEENTGPLEPFYQYGTLDTSGTGGGSAMEDVTPVFAESRARSMVTAARALDPSDPSVPRELVTLPGDSTDRDEAKETLLGAAQDAIENPIEVGGLTPAQREAAEEYDDSEGGRATLGGMAHGTGGGKRHDQQRSLRDLDGDGADDRTELKQDAAEVKATVSQGSTGRRQQAATQQGAQQAQGR